MSTASRRQVHHPRLPQRYLLTCSKGQMAGVLQPTSTYVVVVAVVVGLGRVVTAAVMPQQLHAEEYSPALTQAEA